jgi:flagellar hook-length control protein FliK
MLIDLLGPAIAAEDNSSKKAPRTSDDEDNRFGEFLDDASEPGPEPQEKEIRLSDFVPSFVVQQPLLNVTSMPAPSTTTTPLPGPAAQNGSPLPTAEPGHQVEQPESNRSFDSTPSRSAETTPEASKPDAGKETRQEERAEAAKIEETKTEKTAAEAAAAAADESGDEPNPTFAAGAEGFTLEGEGEIADEELQQKFQQAKSNQPAQQQTNPATQAQTDAPVQAKTAAVAATGNGVANNNVGGQTGQAGGANGQSVTPAANVNGTTATNGTAQTEKTTAARRPHTPPPIPRQVLNSLKNAIANGDNEIQIRLDPPELGSMKLFLQLDGDSVRVILETSNELAKRALEESLDDLRKMLEDEGLEVDEFLLRDESENPEADARQSAGEEDGLPGNNAESEEETTAAELERASRAYGLFSDKHVNMVA